MCLFTPLPPLLLEHQRLGRFWPNLSLKLKTLSNLRKTGETQLWWVMEEVSFDGTKTNLAKERKKKKKKNARCSGTHIDSGLCLSPSLLQASSHVRFGFSSTSNSWLQTKWKKSPSVKVFLARYDCKRVPSKTWTLWTWLQGGGCSLAARDSGGRSLSLLLVRFVFPVPFAER